MDISGDMQMTADDIHPEHTELNLKDCTIVHISNVIGGRLIIAALPEFPPIDCSQNGCYEFSEYLVTVFTNSNEQYDSFLCEEHKNLMLKLRELEIPFEVNH